MQHVFRGASVAFSCIICGCDASTSFLTDCQDYYLQSGSFTDYHRCNRCGLIQQFPLPEDVAALYEDYPIHRSRPRWYSLARRSVMSGAYRHPTLWPRNTLLLDFGCGDGWYLEWCREYGMQVVGFEPDTAHAEGLENRLRIPAFSDFERLAAAYPKAFDVVTLHFVVEHLTDIQSVLKDIQRVLKPSGTIRYVVPSIDSWEFRLFGRKWHSLDPPRHISFPDARHAQYLADALSLKYDGEDAVAFPNGLAGSLTALLAGRFRPVPFFALLPLAWPVTGLWPSGNRAYRFVSLT